MWFKGYNLLSSNLEPWFYIIIFFIYWDIVALQQCAIFCCTMKWISYLYTYIQSFKPVNPKGNRPWIFIGRTDAKAEAPILWPSDAKNWLTGKDPDSGEDWRQEEKGTTEDEMVDWHHWLEGPEFEQAPGVGDGQGSLECCSPWGLKELDTTEQLNWTLKLWHHYGWKFPKTL